MDESTVSSGPEIVSVDVELIEKELAPVGVIKSTTHGRIRMQLRPEYRTPEMMAQIKAQLEKDERVQEVTINERTGSVTVKYASEHSGHGLLWKAMQEAELVGEAAFELPEDEEEPGEGGGGGESTYGKLDGQVAERDLQIRPGSFPAHPRQDSPARAGGSPRPGRTRRGSDRHIRNRTGAAAGASPDLDRP